MNRERFPEPEPDMPDKRFYECGGEILRCSEDGSPIEWICGLDPEDNNELIHPAGVEEPCACLYLDHEGKWRGVIDNHPADENKWPQN